MTIDSSARRLSTSINSGPGQGAERLAEGLAVVVVGDGRTAAHDIDQLANLVLPNMNDIAVHFVRAAASGHEGQQRAPPLHDGSSQHRAERTGVQRPALLLEFLDAGENANL